ncbi:MAG: BMC domain-containing protein [Oscillospiraceae bacterium]
MNRAVLIVEYSSISCGMGMLDRLVKQSVIVPLYARPICIGKFVMIFSGDVENLRESQKVLQSVGQERLVSTFLLTAAHRDLLAYFSHFEKRHKPNGKVEALGIFETRTIASGLFSLDASLKSGNVTLLKVGMGQLIGGKCYFLLTGTVSDVQQALAHGHSVLPEKDFIGMEVIPSPDGLTLTMLLEGYHRADFPEEMTK